MLKESWPGEKCEERRKGRRTHEEEIIREKD